MPNTHYSHLDNNWYNHNKNNLKQELTTYFTIARNNFPITPTGTIKALIVPHAGYYYSALCATTAYQALIANNPDKKNNSIQKVIILAPSHTQTYQGIALPDYTSYQTPLGSIPVDQQSIALLKQNPIFLEHPVAHATEHSLEVQLPFLQSTIESFTIIPLITGRLSSSDCTSAANSLNLLCDDSTLIVVSSDFIHQGKSYDYSPFSSRILDNIRTIDSQAIQAIGKQSITDFEAVLQKTGATICGQEPIRLLLTLINQNNPTTFTTSLTCYYTSVHAQAAQENRSSFDTYALLQDMTDKQSQQSVSYAALVMTNKNSNTHNLNTLLTGYEQKSLIAMSRAILENYFTPDNQKKPASLLLPVLSPALSSSYGAFVTLTSPDGQLRGCIGRITTQEPLYKTVQAMILDAALHDSRFTPLTKKELPEIQIEISILSKPRPIASPDEIIVGKHGIILNHLNAQKKITHSAVFLAHVATEFNWTLETTLEQLSIKAGLNKDDWKNNTNFEIFEEIVIKET